jgi:hypothetical protein
MGVRLPGVDGRTVLSSDIPMLPAHVLRHAAASSRMLLNKVPEVTIRFWLIMSSVRRSVRPRRISSTSISGRGAGPVAGLRRRRLGPGRRQDRHGPAVAARSNPDPKTETAALDDLLAALG